MPIDVDLDGYFSCRKGSTDYRVQFGEHNVTADDIGDVFYCGAMHSGMHIRPDGRVVPCMGLSDSVWGDRMPSVLEDHLWDISIDPRFRDLADTKVSALLEKKRFFDMTGNNVNHPNDFLASVYAQTILKILGVL